MSATVVVISDTGPLSYLHRLRRLDLLPTLFGRILVPPAVVAELNAGHRLGYDLPDVAGLSWIEIRPPPADALRGIVGLDAGETEAVALATTLADVVVLLDDGPARQRATRLGLRITGTVGVLLLAKERSLIDRVAPELDRLSTFGFRLAVAVRDAALRRAGEME
jgi:predicted nucleic acid-binding protein